MTIPHTSGPWTVHPYLRPDLDDDPMGVYVVEEAKDKLTALYFDTEPNDGSESEAALAAIHAENAANACLLGAAPELRDALKTMMYHYTEHEAVLRQMGLWTEGEDEAACRKARVALAHAEGKESWFVEGDCDA